MQSTVGPVVTVHPEGSPFQRKEYGPTPPETCAVIETFWPTSTEEVASVEKEMVDRFGPYPEQVRILVEIEAIRAVASILAIDEILEDSRSIRIKITSASRVDVGRLVTLMKTDRRLDRFLKFP